VLQALPEQEREKYGYERDLLRMLEELVAGVDRKVSSVFVLVLMTVYRDHAVCTSSANVSSYVRGCAGGAQS
jgi:hypothetical protein